MNRETFAELDARIAAEMRREDIDAGVIPQTVCVCSDVNVCQFHARQPKPCPTGCGGQIQRYDGRDGYKLVPVAVLHTSHVVLQKRSDPIWTCSTCEYCR